MSQPDILTISSYNSIETQTASNFEAMLPNAVVNPKRMILNKFIMPNLMYDISPSYNRVSMIFWPDPSIQWTVTISLNTGTHWASGADFAAYLLAAINAQFAAQYPGGPQPGITAITYSTTTGKLTIDPNNNYGFSINAWNVPDPITAASAWYKLGFTSTSGVGYSSRLPAGQTLTADSPLILLSTNVIYVSISLLGNSLNDKRNPDGTVVGDDSIYGCIPVNASFGQLIIYGDQFGSFVSTNVNTVRSIRVTLLDEEYNQLVLPQNCYATMEFRLEYS
jgi:hypothetical protein